MRIENGKLKALVQERCGGVAGLMNAWHVRYVSAPDRSTFYDWLGKERFSSSFANFLRLCACVDVDPAFLIRSEGKQNYNAADAMLRKALGDVGGRGVRPRDVVDIFGPIASWPASPQIIDAYGRDWLRKEFENPGRNAFYQRLRISFPDKRRPRVLHFAYRVNGSALWRVYGFVEYSSSSARLVNYFGPLKHAGDAFPDGLLIETYFGEGACSFCVASLHPFTIDLLSAAYPATSALRFEA